MAADSVDRALVAAKIAAECATDVDARARFPIEAVDALRDVGLLAPGPSAEEGLWKPTQLLAVAEVLGAACGSTGLIWAMHQGQLRTLLRHTPESDRAREFVRRSWTGEALLGSVISERRAGNSREAAAEFTRTEHGRITLRKPVAAASYIEQADAILVSGNRAGPAGSQSALAFAARSDYSLQVTQRWNAIGMRGTESHAVDLVLDAAEDQLLAGSLADISSQTMNPYTHLGWAGCWIGIADNALEIVRGSLRRANDPESGYAAYRNVRFSELRGRLAGCRATAAGFAAYLEDSDVPSLSRTVKTNQLRLAAADTTSAIVLACLEMIGATAYANSAGTLSRAARDILSAPIMVSSDRIRFDTAQIDLYAGRDSAVTTGRVVPAAREHHDG